MWSVAGVMVSANDVLAAAVAEGLWLGGDAAWACEWSDECIVSAVGVNDEETAAVSGGFPVVVESIFGELSSVDWWGSAVPVCALCIDAEESMSEEAFDAMRDDTGGSDV